MQQEVCRAYLTDRRIQIVEGQGLSQYYDYIEKYSQYFLNRLPEMKVCLNKNSFKYIDEIKVLVNKFIFENQLDSTNRNPQAKSPPSTIINLLLKKAFDGEIKESINEEIRFLLEAGNLCESTNDMIEHINLQRVIYYKNVHQVQFNYSLIKLKILLNLKKHNYLSNAI